MTTAPQLTPEQKLYLSTMWELTSKPRPDGSLLSFGFMDDAARIQLHGQLPADFDAKTIDWRFYTRGMYITLLAIEQICPHHPILSIAERAVNQIKAWVTSSSVRDSFSNVDLAKALKVSRWDAYLACQLLVSTGLLGREAMSSLKRHEYDLHDYEYVQRILNFTSLVEYLREFEAGKYDTAHKRMEVRKTKIFIVHGRNLRIRDQIDLFLTKELELQTVVMEAGPHLGRPLPEKFEEISTECGFAVFILSADDELAYRSDGKKVKRARQNVILETGYFWAALGRRGHVAFLVEKDPEMELPSDIQGIAWIPITADLAETKLKLHKELKAAGLV